jgi:acetyl-CoA carboxylase biotin carboxyl carrier protein
MNLDLEELAAIIEQLEQADFTEFRYEKGDLRLHVRRDGHDAGPADRAPAAGSQPVAPVAQAPTSSAAVGTPGSAAAPPPAAAPVPAPAAPAPAAAQAPPAGLDPANLPEGHVVVRAPMLGTFYGAPKPGAAPFVSVGDAVGPESTLCIIEVMKLMNSVPAGVSGEIAAVFLADGDLAEFDQPLFAVQVSA